MGRRKVNSLVTRARKRRQEAFDKLLAACKAFADQAKIIDSNNESEGIPRDDTFTLFRYMGSLAAICIGDCRRAREAVEFAEETLRTRLIDETFERR